MSHHDSKSESFRAPPRGIHPHRRCKTGIAVDPRLLLAPDVYIHWQPEPHLVVVTRVRLKKILLGAQRETLSGSAEKEVAVVFLAVLELPTLPGLTSGGNWSIRHVAIFDWVSFCRASFLGGHHTGTELNGS